MTAPVYRKPRFVAALLLLAYTSCGGEGPTEPVAVATTIAANSSTSVSAVAGAAVSPPPSVVIRDQNGNPFPGATVNFEVLSGGGSITGATAVTDASGIATAGQWTVGNAAGPNVLNASSGSLSVSFTATGIAGPAGSMTVAAGSSQTSVAGSVLPVSPAVRVQDASGNPKQGVTVNFAVVSGGGSITGATVVTDASGVATAGQWTLGKTAGPNVLSASSGTLSANFTATGIAGPTASITVAAGDHQIAVNGSIVPISPAVLVQDANGNPKQGVTVTFTVGVGGGSVSGAIATSNAAGIAAVGSWKLGDTPGTNTLIATTIGAAPVTFTATSGTAKCLARTPTTLGSTTGGTLDANDCQFPDGRFVDFFSTTLPDANAYLFRQSGNFDTYLDLTLADGTVIAENDDESQTNTNSAIKALLPPGTYVLGASSFNPGITGTYSISSQVTSTDNANCELMFVVRNVSTTQRIAATDCLWTQPPASPVYADAYYILLRAGQSITINMSSTEVDSYLELVRVSGMRVAQNDDRVSTTKDAQITFTATVTDYYAIVARTAIASQTGAYTLTIQ